MCLVATVVWVREVTHPLVSFLMAFRVEVV